MVMVTIFSLRFVAQKRQNPRMSFSHLDGKTLFFNGPAKIHGEGQPTIRDTKRFGRLKVSGKAVRFEPIEPDSAWWIGFRPDQPEKFRENKDRREFTYRGQQVVPDFLCY
jgi:hypothetical protein